MEQCFWKSMSDIEIGVDEITDVSDRPEYKS